MLSHCLLLHDYTLSRKGISGAVWLSFIQDILIFFNPAHSVFHKDQDCTNWSLLRSQLRGGMQRSEQRWDSLHEA